MKYEIIIDSRVLEDFAEAFELNTIIKFHARSAQILI